MKFVMQCLNRSLPTIELTIDKAARLGPPLSEAPFSRVEAYPDYVRGKIRIKNLGVTKCLINFRQVLRHGEEASISPGELVDLTFGTYVYQARVGLNSALMPTTLAVEDMELEEPAAHSHHDAQSVSSAQSGSGGTSIQSVAGSSAVPTTGNRRFVPEKNGNSGHSSNQSISSQSSLSGVGRLSQGSGDSDDDDDLNSVVSTSDSGMVIEDTSIHVMSGIANDPNATGKGRGSVEVEEGPAIHDTDWNMIQGRLGQMPVLVYGGEDLLKFKPRVAAFDLDLTLIQPNLKKDLPSFLPIVNGRLITTALWRFLYPDTVAILRQFMAINQDYKLVIVTNKAISGFNISKAIIEEVVLALDIPLIVFAAKEGTEFLKPGPFIWSVYSKFYNEDEDPDWVHSFFCGDCAGRVDDISKGDRLFALNVGTDFKTPEEFFRGVPPNKLSLQMPLFNPIEYANSPIVARNNDHIVFKYKLEMVLMCGIVASGKTRYVETTLVPRGYAHVHPSAHLNTVKSRLEFITASITSKTNVVVDRRNIDTEERASYIRLAHSLHVPIRCFVMNVSESHARHNLRFHEIRTSKLFNGGEVELSMRRHKALFETPRQTEGFDDIVYVNFIPKTFLTDPSDLEIYSKFLVQR